MARPRVGRMSCAGAMQDRSRETGRAFAAEGPGASGLSRPRGAASEAFARWSKATRHTRASIKGGGGGPRCGGGSGPHSSWEECVCGQEIFGDAAAMWRGWAAV